jgi:hypothetical protein
MKSTTQRFSLRPKNRLYLLNVTKPIAVAAMRKLLVLCFGVLKSGKPFDPGLAMPN